MQKVTVRFISEGMSIIPFLRQMTKKNMWIKKVVREYLRKAEYNINYIEFLLIKCLYVDLFEYYTFTFYKYWEEFEYQYSNIDIVNNLSKYASMFSFHPHLRTSTKHHFIGHSEGIRVIIEIVQRQFELNNNGILATFLWYTEKTKPELYFFHFLSTIFLMSIATGYKEISMKDRLVWLTISPDQWFRPGPTRGQKIEITSLNPASIAKISRIICTQKIQGLYVITGCKYKNRRAIEIIKTILINNFIEILDYRILGPDQSIEFSLNRNNLFLIFDDGKNVFDKIGYKNNFGIYLKKI